MKTYTNTQEILNTLTELAPTNKFAVVQDGNNIYTYDLAEKEIDRDYKPRELLRLVFEDRISIVEVEP